MINLNCKDMFKVNRITSEQQSVESCFNLICWLRINHDWLQAMYKTTLFHQNKIIRETTMHHKRKFVPNTISAIMNISTIVSNCFIASITMMSATLLQISKTDLSNKIIWKIFCLKFSALIRNSFPEVFYKKGVPEPLF